MTEGISTFAYDSLESIRKRLLDLSSRNALLNYKFPRGKCLQFIDTTPDILFNALNENVVLDLVPVPKPSDSEIKKYYGTRVRVIDSPKIVASYVRDILSKNDLLNFQHEEGNTDFYLSDITKNFEKISKKFFGNKISLELKKL